VKITTTAHRTQKSAHRVTRRTVRRLVEAAAAPAAAAPAARTAAAQDVAAPNLAGLKLTVEESISAEHIAHFYQLYLAAMAPMQTRAAARHLLTAEEFTRDMTDPRVQKHVVWDENGTPVGLGTYTLDLATVPFISPSFYERCYPQEYARGAIVYLGFLLVHPGARGQGALRMILNSAIDLVRSVDGVIVFDVCAHNDANTLGYMRDLMLATGESTIEPVDVQTYYAASFTDAATFGGKSA
jgi:GNAT superfamily N-acetyltransferase